MVTENIEEQFEKLLGKMQAAMEAGGENEVGVWVSGFYGSGKSSFTKYLGLAFDDNVTIDGTPFIQHLQNRLKKQTTKQLLSTVVKRFPADVVMLDLASTQTRRCQHERSVDGSLLQNTGVGRIFTKPESGCL